MHQYLVTLYNEGLIEGEDITKALKRIDSEEKKAAKATWKVCYFLSVES